MRASIGVTGYPRSGKLPAPLCHRSPTPIQAVRGSRLTPAAASRCSKICPFNRPCQHAPCKASVRPDTQGPANCPRRRAIALRHSLRLCAAAGSLPLPLLDARKLLNLRTPQEVATELQARVNGRERQLQPEYSKLCTISGLACARCRSTRKLAKSVAHLTAQWPLGTCVSASRSQASGARADPATVPLFWGGSIHV